MKIQSHSFANAPVRSQAQPPEDPQPNPSRDSFFNSDTLTQAAGFGGLALITSTIGATCGGWGTAAVGAGSLIGGAALSRGLDSGAQGAATIGLTVISTASALSGTLFGGYGVAGATLAGVGLGLWTASR